MSVFDSSGSNFDDVFGSSEVGLSSVVNLNSVVVLVLKFKLSQFSGVLLVDGEVESELSLGLLSLEFLQDSSGISDDLHSFSDGQISCDLLSFNLFDVINKRSVSVRNVNDVVGCIRS